MKRRTLATALAAVVFLFAFAILVGGAALKPAHAEPTPPIAFTILHTNDFHGQLQGSGSNPGLARVAAVVNGVRAAKGAGNVILTDSGDEMQGSLLSNLQKGAPTIAAFNAMGTDVATFGNHEFDWGQQNLADRTTQASYPFVTANIVQNDTGNCATAGWTPPSFADGGPYTIKTVAGVKVAFIGVTTTETPTITVATATQGLCFKDPFDAIVHYYDQMKANADVIVVLSHLGYTDGGYGYGIPVIGDQTLAKKLADAGKPVPLIIGGHSHTKLTTATVVSGTTIVQAYYNGREVDEADMTFDPATKAVTVNWTKPAVSTTGPEDATVKAVIDSYANDPAYLAKVNQPIGYSAVDLPRSGGLDNMMGDFVDDAIYNYLNTDGTSTNDVDVFLNNAGGIRTDWCWDSATSTWLSTGCKSGTHAPALLTYGNMFTILPFGNATVVGTMTGAQLLQVLNQAPLVSNGPIQPAGLKFKYFAYKDALPGPQPYAWGAFDYTIYDRAQGKYIPIDMNKTYSVGTNEFLAPAGGDGYAGFKYMKNITYWGDMLDAVDSFVSQHYGTAATAYTGPNGDGSLDGRVVRDGTDMAGSGSIVPITILHNNDSHGNLAKTNFVGYTQLATLIKQERAHNPNRTLLLDAGDQIQGDAMMYYFKSAPSGFASDGTALPGPLTTHPMMAVMNGLGYDAMTLGNHEFNFGAQVFDGIFKQAQFHVLGANVTDTGAYGLSQVGPGGEGVQPYFTKTLGGVKVAVIGITNHRVPNYELPSNIPGLTFTNPLTKAQEETNALRGGNDVVVALTHIGFTQDPKSVEVDSNVDTQMASDVSGLDAIIGGHSHTSPVTAFGDYKYLPTIVGGPNNTPVLVTQAYRYNNYLGEVVLGLRAKAGGGYEVVSRAGQYIAVTSATPEDPATKAIVDPYVAQINLYNNRVVGQTTAPIDTLKAFTEETNGANLQADASVWELNQHGIHPDIHLSGAMTNKKMADTATEANPVTLKISDMFAGMPYENSLVTLRMNGPQLKAVLERAYRNYYYYKYVPGYGGYSYYTTCMIDTNSIGKIVYRDGYPALPDGNNVGALLLNGTRVDFTDATKYYLVSTVNYLAAGSCNFNDNGVSLWPLNQIVNDTQYYVRDAVIDYLAAQGTVSPKIEGRIAFDSTAPVTTATAPTGWQNTPAAVTFAATDDLSGVKATLYTIDGGPTQTGTSFTVSADGDHTILYWSVDYAGNVETAHSLVVKVDRTPPVVTYSPSGLVYDATDTVTLTCTATDALSGVVSSTCANVSAPAWQFVVGPKPSATATDAAGNVGTGTAVFTVRPSTHGVSSLVTAWVTKDGIVKSLTAHLDAAAASRARGQDGAADNELAAFRNELAAQGDKALTADHAATLAALSRLL